MRLPPCVCSVFEFIFPQVFPCSSYLLKHLYICHVPCFYACVGIILTSVMCMRQQECITVANSLQLCCLCLHCDDTHSTLIHSPITLHHSYHIINNAMMMMMLMCVCAFTWIWRHQRQRSEPCCVDTICPTVQTQAPLTTQGTSPTPSARIYTHVHTFDHTV